MMKSLEKSFNKTSESYACVLSDCKEQGAKVQKRKIRKKTQWEKKDNEVSHTEKNNKLKQKAYKEPLKLYFDKSPDKFTIKGAKVHSYAIYIIGENRIKQQLLQDFENFARRMRLQYIFQGQDNERQPFYVRSNWVPPVQPSFALETFLEEVKVELADIQLSKPKHNLPYNERMAIRELKGNSEINIKKADKGTTTVIMNKQDKIREG